MDFPTAMAWCSHGFAATRAAFAGPFAPVVALFLAGIAGSPGHCAAMCGPLVMGQVSDRLARLPVACLRPGTRLGAGMLLPYHAGRVTTYAGLGAAMGALGSGIVRVPWLGWAAALLLLSAAAAFLVSGLRALAPALDHVLPRAGPVWSLPIAKLARRIGAATPLGGYGLGLALGFLPCGFLYAGLAVATGTASPLWGALAMLGFGLGTMPSLIAVGVAGHWAGRRLDTLTLRVAPLLMLINAAALAGIGVQRLAPLLP